MSERTMLGGALAIAAVMGCSDSPSPASLPLSATDVTGTYVAADSGRNFGKNWCYSGALVLDSTGHFGSVITMCGDNGGAPATERLSGTYHLTTVSTREKGGPGIRRVKVVLDRQGLHDSHTLLYDAGTLRFDEPWWMGAGLRALEIPDPVLKRVSSSRP